MSLMNYFKTSKTNSAQLAKERLQILVAHDKSSRSQPSYLPEMQQELLKVIQKYIHVDKDAISVQFEGDDDQEVLELNIVVPEEG